MIDAADHDGSGTRANPPGVRRGLAGIAWFVAAAVCLPLSCAALVLGLVTTSLPLVYLSIALSVAWLPMVFIGIVRFAGRKG